MNIRITGHHVDITDAMSEYVKAKLKRVVRHFDQIVHINVVMTVERSKEGVQHKAEARIPVKGGLVVAESSSHDMYAAVDAMEEKLERACQKRKQEMKGHHHEGHKRMEA